MSEAVFLLFPGQGAQVVGMARDAFEAGGHAVALYEEASEILGFDLAALTFRGEQAELDRTENCQPAMLVASLALLSTLRERRNLRFCGAAGLSLGEYTALTALESIDFADAVKLVRRRGQLMEAAARERPGTMASVLGSDPETVTRCCREASAETGGVVVPANFNCPGQIVISGEAPALERAREKLSASGAKRVLPLAVSGAFHSPLMESAREGLSAALAETTIRAPNGLFYNNADAEPLTDAARIRESLARQLVSPVRWEATCSKLVRGGQRLFYEVGPGRTCQGLMKRISSEAAVTSIGGLADIEALPE